MLNHDKESSLWLGVEKEKAQWIFLLPNMPELPTDCDVTFLTAPNVPLLIELNGNHWRKIFTIMAKLITPPQEEWRYYRDCKLFEQCAITFNVESLPDAEQMSSCIDKPVVFVVGNALREKIPIKDGALLIGEEQIGEKPVRGKHHAFFMGKTIWCPYLDYRQFPNQLVADIRHSALNY